MSFNLNEVRSYSEKAISNHIRKAVGGRVTAAEAIKLNNLIVLNESRQFSISDRYHIFLSHSFLDAEIILGISEILTEMKYRVYVDWVDDPHLSRADVNKSTAQTLRSRIEQSQSLLYATTKNSENSKWMPWELGVMDGLKNKAAILPIFAGDSHSDTFSGQEYLGIYPYCIKAVASGTTKEKLWICESSEIYISFDGWLNGKKPTKHS